MWQQALEQGMLAMLQARLIHQGGQTQRALKRAESVQVLVLLPISWSCSSGINSALLETSMQRSFLYVALYKCAVRTLSQLQTLCGGEHADTCARSMRSDLLDHP